MNRLLAIGGAILITARSLVAGTLNVVSAEYGTRDSKVRVDPKRFGGVPGVFHFVTVGNSLVDKDPAPYKPKELTVTYLVKGKKQEIRCPEGESFVFSGDAIPLTKNGTIAAAYYGIDKKWSNVAGSLRMQVAKGVDFTAGSIIPPAQKKDGQRLVVFTTIGGTVRSSLFAGSDTVSIRQIAPGEMAKYMEFKPGTEWYDTDGSLINAHGGGVLYQNGTYYWFGEVKGRWAGAEVGVSCYSSSDLYNWKNEGVALAVAPDERSEIQKGCIMERPKVIFNKKTGKYVMWFHLELKGEGYKSARTGVAVSDKPAGPYKYLRSYRPNAGDWPGNAPEGYKTKTNGGGQYLILMAQDVKEGQASRDMTVFVDDDGKAYHIHAAEDNATLHISELSEDYTSFSGKWIRVSPSGWNEAPAVIKHKDTYYMITSGCTGWDPNEARLFSSASMLGEWTFLGNPCSGKEAELTFKAQGTFIIPVSGKRDAFIFMADRWDKGDLGQSRYVWLPILFKADGTPQIKWMDPWTLAGFGP